MIIDQGFLNYLLTSNMPCVQDVTESVNLLIEEIKGYINKIDKNKDKEKLEYLTEECEIVAEFIIEQIPSILCTPNEYFLDEPFVRYLNEVDFNKIENIVEALNVLDTEIQGWIKETDKKLQSLYEVKDYKKIEEYTELLNYLDKCSISLTRYLTNLKPTKKIEKDDNTVLDTKKVIENNIVLDSKRVINFVEDKYKRILSPKDLRLMDLIDLGALKEGNTLQIRGEEEYSKVTKKGQVLYDDEEWTLNSWVGFVKDIKHVNAYRETILVDTGEVLDAVRDRVFYKIQQQQKIK